MAIAVMTDIRDHVEAVVMVRVIAVMTDSDANSRLLAGGGCCSNETVTADPMRHFFWGDDQS